VRVEYLMRGAEMSRLDSSKSEVVDRRSEETGDCLAVMAGWHSRSSWLPTRSLDIQVNVIELRR
jgi:hypothetical protein